MNIVTYILKEDNYIYTTYRCKNEEEFNIILEMLTLYNIDYTYEEDYNIVTCIETK